MSIRGTSLALAGAAVLVVAVVVIWQANQPEPTDEEVTEQPTTEAPQPPAAELPDAETEPEAEQGPEEEVEPEPAPSPDDDVVEEREGPSLLLVVGDTDLISPEDEMRTALEEMGFAIEVLDDEDSSAEAASDHDVVVISKTVASEEIADVFREVQAGVVFWEDNAQAIEQGGDEEGEAGGGTLGLATIDVVNPEHTAWHNPRGEVYVNPDAPEELRAGLSGSVTFYRDEAEMTFAPLEDGESTTASSATWVAEYGSEGNGRYVYYVIEADAGLADGTESHGRRVYFGLYDETFPLLTDDGRALFEAAVQWAASGE